VAAEDQISTIERLSLVGLLVLIAGGAWQAASQETNSAVSVIPSRFSADYYPLFVSNLAYHFALERTNPALAKALAEKGEAQERRLEVNAHRTITFLQDFSMVYPTHINYWDYTGQSATKRVWSMQTGLYGRCELRMNVPFVVDSTETNIVSYGEPTLVLITCDDPPPGHFHSLYPELSRCSFTASDWTNLVRAGGDLSVLGFRGTTNKPLPYFETDWKLRKW
jgi:hypothetical protein